MGYVVNTPVFLHANRGLTDLLSPHTASHEDGEEKELFMAYLFIRLLPLMNELNPGRHVVHGNGRFALFAQKGVNALAAMGGIKAAERDLYDRTTPLLDDVVSGLTELAMIHYGNKHGMEKILPLQKVQQFNDYLARQTLQNLVAIRKLAADDSNTGPSDPDATTPTAPALDFIGMSRQIAQDLYGILGDTWPQHPLAVGIGKMPRAKTDIPKGIMLSQGNDESGASKQPTATKTYKPSREEVAPFFKGSVKVDELIKEGPLYVLKQLIHKAIYESGLSRWEGYKAVEPTVIRLIAYIRVYYPKELENLKIHLKGWKNPNLSEGGYLWPSARALQKGFRRGLLGLGGNEKEAKDFFANTPVDVENFFKNGPLAELQRLLGSAFEETSQLSPKAYRKIEPGTLRLMEYIRQINPRLMKVVENLMVKYGIFYEGFIDMPHQTELDHNTLGWEFEVGEDHMDIPQFQVWWPKRGWIKTEGDISPFTKIFLGTGVPAQLQPSEGIIQLNPFDKSDYRVKIEIVEGHVYLEDLGFSGGVFINEERIPLLIPIILGEGDRIAIGGPHIYNLRMTHPGHTNDESGFGTWTAGRIDRLALYLPGEKILPQIPTLNSMPNWALRRVLVLLGSRNGQYNDFAHALQAIRELPGGGPLATAMQGAYEGRDHASVGPSEIRSSILRPAKPEDEFEDLPTWLGIRRFVWHHAHHY
ncbi:MAG: FHA domain-containing protein [Deltaproteobacteria bacterium]|nr:FHA domain-containing protein [Deltaproteobacteria bacterium]